MNNSIPFHQSVSNELKQVLSTGEKQVKEFISDRLLMRKQPITETISKNNFSLLNKRSSKNDNPIKLTVPFMNKLRSAVEHRTVKADEFFNGEIYGVPQCFSVDGTDQMYHGTKSSIQDRLPSCQEPILSPSDKKAIILEASPILRKLGNAVVENFHEFAVVFYNYIIRKAVFFNRLDIIFDRHFSNSLKSQTREGRGSSGTRVTTINDDVPFPSNFLNSFLCNVDNKDDLGIYLASKVISIHRVVGNMNLQICVTQNDTIMSVPTAVNDEIFQISSTAEEADQKIVRHALRCIRSGYSDIVVQSIDTDVLVLLLAYVAKTLELMDDSVLNVYFTLVTANPKWFDIISLVNHLGIEICKATPCPVSIGKENVRFLIAG